MSKTRTDLIEEAILASLEHHQASINNGLNVTHLSLDIKFDRSTGAPGKAVLCLTVENYVKQNSLGSFTFDENQAISS